jgi:hypothetical protein
MPEPDPQEALGFTGTYPLDQGFWVPAGDTDAYPWRYGDLLHVPSDVEALTVEEPGEGDAAPRTKPWHAVMVLHPACDLGAKRAPQGVQVVRCAPSTTWEEGPAGGLTGYTIRDGIVRDAHVSLVYLAGVAGSAHHEGHMFADLRTTARVPLPTLEAAGRIAAMTHEARVAVIAREMRFRYLWGLKPTDVMTIEKARIGRDADFKGPRPTWAPLAPS